MIDHTEQPDGDHVDPDVGKTYRVVEIHKVTDHDLEEAMNRMSARGWVLDRIDYVREPGVRRPQMAFLFFMRAPAR